MIRFFATAAVILVLDQASKWLVHTRVEVGEVIGLFGSWAVLRHVHNTGAAFGLFPGNRTVFIIVSLISVVAVIYLVISGRYAVRGSRIAFGMVMGGAIGNLIDRLWLGYVIDFIDIGMGVHRWPTFNVADIGVTVGVLYLAAGFVALEWVEHRGAKTRSAGFEAEQNARDER